MDAKTKQVHFNAKKRYYPLKISFPLSAFYKKLDRQERKGLTEASHESAIDLAQLRNELYDFMGMCMPTG